MDGRDGDGQVTLFERGNDDLGTPAWVLDIVRRIVGQIELDPCSNPWAQSLVRAESAISKHEGMDGLFRWSTIASRNVWLNPPYSNPKPWALRAVEAADDGLEVFALVKLDGADTAMLQVIDAPGPDSVRTGDRVRIRWVDEPQGLITDIACFEPVEG